MQGKIVKDVMVSLSDYAVVPQTASLFDAIKALDEAQKNLPPERQPYRAILVADDDGKIIGKIGQLAFLKALEPKYNLVGDMEKLYRVNLSPDFVSSMMEQFRFFQDSLNDLCWRARGIMVRDVMRPQTDSIDENAKLRDAISMIVLKQELSILVTRAGVVVGLLRLSDLFDEVCSIMKICVPEGD